MTLKEFDNRIAMYLADGYTEAIITFDQTGIKDIQPIESN
jgi:hypothetical protein